MVLERSIQAKMDDPDAGDSIHTNVVAQSFGYRAALITGSTVFGWCVPLIFEALGERWLEYGWTEVDYRRPVYPTDVLTQRLEPSGKDSFTFSVQNTDGIVCVSGSVGLGEGAWVKNHVRSKRLAPEPAPDPRPILYLAQAPVGQDLSALQHATHRVPALRPEDIEPTDGPAPALILADRVVVNPATLGMQGSYYGHAQYAYEDPSIHVSTRTQQQGLIDAGDTLTIAGHCIEAYEKRGHHYWTTDTTMYSSDGREVARNRYTTAFKHVKPGE